MLTASEWLYSDFDIGFGALNGSMVSRGVQDFHVLKAAGCERGVSGERQIQFLSQCVV